MNIIQAQRVFGAMLLVSAVGCGTEPRPVSEPVGGQQETAETTSVMLDLLTAPTGAQCIRVTMTPAMGTAATQLISITPGGSTASFALTGVPLGTVTFGGDAFNVTCGTIGSSGPTWAADPQSVTVRAGIATTITMTFRSLTTVSVGANFVANIVGVRAGGYSSFVLTDGAPEGWGVGANGGNSPARLSAPTSATAIASGNYHTCAIRNDGTVWCWGYNYYGGVGPGIPINSVTFTPVQVPLPGTATMISAGAYHSCAYASLAVYCWGDNSSGQLGNGMIGGLNVNPVLAYSSVIRALSSGANSNVVATSDGRMVGWGNNANGQLGDGTTTTRSQPVAANGDRTVVYAAINSNHSCNLRADGSVWCRGANFYGQLGDGTTTFRLTAAQVSLPAPAKSIGVGYAHSCALLATGQLMCWGNNNEGEMGDLSSATMRPSPLAVTAFGGETTAISLGVGDNHNCILTPLGAVWCWGANYNGGIGDGTYNHAYGPYKVVLQ